MQLGQKAKPGKKASLSDSAQPSSSEHAPVLAALHKVDAPTALQETSTEVTAMKSSVALASDKTAGHLSPSQSDAAAQPSHLTAPPAASDHKLAAVPMASSEVLAASKPLLSSQAAGAAPVAQSTNSVQAASMLQVAQKAHIPLQTGEAANRALPLESEEAPGRSWSAGQQQAAAMQPTVRASASKAQALLEVEGETSIITSEASSGIKPSVAEILALMHDEPSPEAVLQETAEEVSAHPWWHAAVNLVAGLSFLVVLALGVVYIAIPADRRKSFLLGVEVSFGALSQKFSTTRRSVGLGGASMTGSAPLADAACSTPRGNDVHLSRAPKSPKKDREDQVHILCPQMVVPERGGERCLLLPACARTTASGPIRITDQQGTRVLTVTLQKQGGMAWASPSSSPSSGRGFPWTQLLVTSPESEDTPLAECRLMLEQRFAMYSGTGELFGFIARSILGGQRCILATQSGARYSFKGSFEEQWMKVVDSEGALLAQCRLESIRTDLCWSIRMMPGADVVMVVTGLICTETLTEHGL